MQFETRMYPPMRIPEQGRPMGTLPEQTRMHNVATGQPVVVAMPVGPNEGDLLGVHEMYGGQRVWRAGFCSWLNHMDYFCMSLFFPCIRLGLNAARARLDSFWTVAITFGVLHIIILGWNALNYWKNSQYGDHSATVGNLDGRPPEMETGRLLVNICSLAAVFLRVTYRTRLRARYNIAGSACEDCALHFFCPSCAITQEALQVDQEELGTVSCALRVWPEGHPNAEPTRPEEPPAAPRAQQPEPDVELGVRPGGGRGGGGYAPFHDDGDNDDGAAAGAPAPSAPVSEENEWNNQDSSRKPVLGHAASVEPSAPPTDSPGADDPPVLAQPAWAVPTMARLDN
mmetsp:Transcript_28743/g.66324  ORF Transcript_28743/g.66324 Transcript_28743/m.66324 type:complete len:342 (+) Transcript_28743:25-1050(+)